MDQYQFFLTSSHRQLLSEAIYNFVPDILEGSEDGPLDPSDKSANSREGFGKLVSVIVAAAGSRQIGRPETAE